MDPTAAELQEEEEEEEETSPLFYPQKSSSSVTTASLNSTLVLRPTDFIYAKGKFWGLAPFVLERYRLVFFTVPKVACTVFKQLFRRLEGYKNWRLRTRKLPHNPRFNGLQYLSYYSLEDANHMLTSSNWTRAMFVRDPRDRFFSSYLDKAVRNNGTFVRNHCCNRSALVSNCDEMQERSQSVEGFLNVAKECFNPHWWPQSERMPARMFQYLDFVGHLEEVETDVKKLLERIGAPWETFGVGWGKYENETLFKSTSAVQHATGDLRQGKEFLVNHRAELLERRIEERYRGDYESKYLGLALL